MRGDKVVEIQTRVKASGYDPGRLDGVFGKQTAAAVHSFQLAKGLVADGEVGPLTAAALGVHL